MRIADPYLEELTMEVSTTRRVLERVPEAHLNRPVPAVYGPTADENPFAGA